MHRTCNEGEESKEEVGAPASVATTGGEEWVDAADQSKKRADDGRQHAAKCTHALLAEMNVWFVSKNVTGIIRNERL